MMVLVVYEQTGEWKTPKIDQDRFNFDEFEKNNAVKSPPIAGAFYAVCRDTGRGKKDIFSL